MNISQNYIALSLIVLAVVALLLFFVSKKAWGRRMTPLAGVAFALVVAGTLFGDNRLMGYGLMGMGALLAVVDIFTRTKRT